MNGTFAFSNPEQFKELFGMRQTSDGKLVRKNKLVLNFLKDYRIHKYIRDNVGFNPSYFFGITEVEQLFERCNQMFIYQTRKEDGWNGLSLMGWTYRSPQYRTDEANGICDDGDTQAVRYINTAAGHRVFKMKAGRLYRQIIDSTEFGQNLGESTKLWLCEEFQRRWEAYALQKQEGSFELVVDDDFEFIYNSGNVADIDDFDYSCMFDDDQYPFYEDAVDAKAASLRDEEGYMLARCVIFTNVKGSDGKTYRLAERQYAQNNYWVSDNRKLSSEQIKRIFIKRLYAEGHIDANKRIGAACSDSTAYVDKDGNSLSDIEMRIDMWLAPGDTLSYQDTFKYYDINIHKASNMADRIDYQFDLAETDDVLEDGYYDDYHERYCRELTEVHYDGRWIMCDSDDLDDFVKINCEYYHKDETSCCRCGNNFLDKDGCYSELLDECFCCVSCMDDAEEEYADGSNLVKVDDDWVDMDECTLVHVNPWRTRWYFTEDVERMFEAGEVFVSCREYYIDNFDNEHLKGER